MRVVAQIEQPWPSFLGPILDLKLFAVSYRSVLIRFRRVSPSCSRNLSLTFAATLMVSQLLSLELQLQLQLYL